MLKEKLLLFRAKHSFSQEKVATIANVSKDTILKIEKGQSVKLVTEKKVELAIDREEQKWLGQ